MKTDLAADLCERIVAQMPEKDGTTIYVELGFAIVLDDTGVAIGALAVGRNITERYRQDKSLRQRLAALEQAVAIRAPHAGSADQAADG